MLTCQVEGCGHQDSLFLGDHLAEAHGLSLADYLATHPDAEVVSSVVIDEHAKDAPTKRSHPGDAKTLTIKWGRLTVPVNWDVPEEDCLPLPPAFRFPAHGALKRDYEEASISLASGRKMWVGGLPGCGKDAFFCAWSWLTRTPAGIFQVNPNENIMGWFFERSFDAEGTSYEYGKLFDMLVHGYTSPVSGRKMPYLILITDFDRATKSQAEALRLVLDSIEGRVSGPSGETFKIFPGTQIVVTANSFGAGDTRGRCVSANVMDASLLDRFERMYAFHYMDWKDESEIIRAKFPLFVEKVGDKGLEQLGKAVAALRDAIEKEQVYCEFSHRALCRWVGHAQDILEWEPNKKHSKILKRAARCFLDGMPDEETKLSVDRIISDHIRGGLFGDDTEDEGDDDEPDF